MRSATTCLYSQQIPQWHKNVAVHQEIDLYAVQLHLAVEHHQPVPEQPLAIHLGQAAIVAAGRHQLGLAVPRDDIQQIAGRPRFIAIHLHRQVGNEMPQLRSALVEPREAFGGIADAVTPE